MNRPAMITELTMEKKVWKFTREIQGEPLPDAES
ncbi:hypothetical protein HNR46_004082 [Haloferula luteola]|uniref:Uncharacterized protein n=1 Tax=Haloferula luteola TaxID=595692 RepID=A0A840VJ52_9BACT|nr:hypothetical protein [Haloferula luteola]